MRAKRARMLRPALGVEVHKVVPNTQSGPGPQFMGLARVRRRSSYAE